MSEDPRVREVLAQLADVTDPELDEDVVSLGFVSDVAVEGDGVRIGFRLPTYWCSANFAWIMAEDMRAAALALPWVGSVRLALDEHMYADAINSGVGAGRSFRDAFGAEADAEQEGLDEVRAVFRRKSFGRRQLAVIEALRAVGVEGARVLSLDLATLEAAVPGTLLERYLVRRRELFGAAADLPGLLDLDGRAVAEADYSRHMRTLRSIVTNMEFNGALCRGLLEARYAEAKIGGEPELIDFVRAAARERQAQAA